MFIKIDFDKNHDFWSREKILSQMSLVYFFKPFLVRYIHMIRLRFELFEKLYLIRSFYMLEIYVFFKLKSFDFALLKESNR